MRVVDFQPHGCSVGDGRVQTRNDDWAFARPYSRKMHGVRFLLARAVPDHGRFHDRAGTGDASRPRIAATRRAEVPRREKLQSALRALRDVEIHRWLPQVLSRTTAVAHMP